MCKRFKVLESLHQASKHEHLTDRAISPDLLNQGSALRAQGIYSFSKHQGNAYVFKKQAKKPPHPMFYEINNINNIEILEYFENSGSQNTLIFQYY